MAGDSLFNNNSSNKLDGEYGEDKNDDFENNDDDREDPLIGGRNVDITKDKAINSVHDSPRHLALVKWYLIAHSGGDLKKINIFFYVNNCIEN